MDRKLIWTEKASSDIEAIVRYIARRNPNAAARIGIGIYDRAQILLEHPDAGTILDELREGGWRKLIFRRWKIVYTIRRGRHHHWQSLASSDGRGRFRKTTLNLPLNNQLSASPSSCGHDFFPLQRLNASTNLVCEAHDIQ